MATSIGHYKFRTNLAGARAVTKRLQESSVQLKEDAVNVGKIVVFWILVLLVALYVIDSQ